ncbi:uncharacterized protein LOC115217151 [Argonauta hians]
MERLLLNKLAYPYRMSLTLLSGNVSNFQNKNPVTFNKLSHLWKWHCIRFMNSRRGARKFETSTKNLFDVLEVTPKSRTSDIKKSFYRLSKKYHPDINKSAEAISKFAEISSAYEILKNPIKRQLYEKGLAGSNRTISHEDMKTYKKGADSAEELLSRHGTANSHIKRKAAQYDQDFWYYYGNMKDSRKATHEDIETVLKRYHEEEKQRRGKGLLAVTFVLMFLMLNLYFK